MDGKKTFLVFTLPLCHGKKFFSVFANHMRHVLQNKTDQDIKYHCENNNKVFIAASFDVPSYRNRKERGAQVYVLIVFYAWLFVFGSNVLSDFCPVSQAIHFNSLKLKNFLLKRSDINKRYIFWTHALQFQTTSHHYS